MKILAEELDKLISELQRLQEVAPYPSLTLDLALELRQARQERDAAISESKAWIRKCEEFGNAAENADLQLACIADQLGIKGSITDWLQAIGKAIRDLKQEIVTLKADIAVEESASSNLVEQKKAMNGIITELKAEVERLGGVDKMNVALLDRNQSLISAIESAKKGTE
jgi:hypothetical protein